MPLDSIHFRGPESWRGRIKSDLVRQWFGEFLAGRAFLAATDPGSGPSELSVRISRPELNRAAGQAKISGVALLRRLIAARIELQNGQSARLISSRVVKPALASPVRNVKSSTGELESAGHEPTDKHCIRFNAIRSVATPRQQSTGHVPSFAAFCPQCRQIKEGRMFGSLFRCLDCARSKQC